MKVIWKLCMKQKRKKYRRRTLHFISFQSNSITYWSICYNCGGVFVSDNWILNALMLGWAANGKEEVTFWREPKRFKRFAMAYHTAYQSSMPYKNSIEIFDQLYAWHILNTIHTLHPSTQPWYDYFCLNAIPLSQKWWNMARFIQSLILFSLVRDMLAFQKCWHFMRGQKKKYK